MDTKYSFKLIVPAVLFGMVLSVPAFAEDNMAPASANYNGAPASEDANAPAGQQMRAAGQEMKGAGSDTAAAAKDSFHGTERAVKDTTITAEVKTALKSDAQVGSSEIHVKTAGGVVTLKGNVPSPDVAARAAQIAQQKEGVKSVDNRLMVANSARSD
jgi:hyperosmotically inducible periplasmic protein